ncbi:uncharacterized protein [Ptychodera flava]|uniref:uncharacterized protein n=1 Tax=Ptychodera flava TaxID=63121 RepID=UPI00396A41FF
MWEEVEGSESGDSKDTVVDITSSPVDVHQVPSDTNICGPVCLLRKSTDKEREEPQSTDSLLESEKNKYERLRQKKSKDVKFEHRDSLMVSDPFMQAVDEAAVAAVIIARAREARDSAENALELAIGACRAANASLEVAEYVAKCARVTAHIALDICNFASFDEAYQHTTGHKITLDDFKSVLRFPESKPDSLSFFSSSEELKHIRYSSDSTVSGTRRIHDSDLFYDSEYSVTSQHRLGPNVSHKVRMWEDKVTKNRPTSAKTPQRVFSEYMERPSSCPCGSYVNARCNDPNDRYSLLFAREQDELASDAARRHQTGHPICDDEQKITYFDTEAAPSSSDDSESPGTQALKPKRSKQLQRVSKTEAESPLTKMYVRRRRRASGSSGTDSPERPVSPLVHGENSQKRLDMQLQPATSPQTFHPGKFRSDTTFQSEKE